MKLNPKKIDEIRNLYEKNKIERLSEDEEKRYVKLSSEATGMPEEIFANSFNDKLNDILSKTDKLLNDLEEKEQENKKKLE